MKREEKLEHAVQAAIEARGVHGVHVAVDSTDTAYLDGEVANLGEEVIAVEAAIDVGAGTVVDGIHYPGQEAAADHFEGRRAHLLQDGHHHHQAGLTPEQQILGGARMDGRLFDSNIYPPIPTGNPID